MPWADPDLQVAVLGNNPHTKNQFDPFVNLESLWD